MNINKLKSWFLQEKRAFPWRETKDPYAIWVSEIMLQQTLANVVVPYFRKWMELFPDIASLANASKEDVVKAWEGLGYYSRARNLHAGAQCIVERHGGMMPNSKEELLALPGIGDYTAGAILNFAFQKKYPAIDSNVMRVMTRFLTNSVKKEIYAYLEKILPEEEPQIISEALIELGALVCKKNPDCTACPLRQECRAYTTGVEKDLPVQKKREKTIFIERIALIIEHENKVLLKKESQAKVMQDLFEFPFVEKRSADPLREAEYFFTGMLKFRGAFLAALGKEKHSFTKYCVTLYPFLFAAESIQEVEGCIWVPKEDLPKLPFSSGHRKLKRGLETHSRTQSLD